MRKFENVDIVDSLRRIMDTNTRYYKKDFAYDVKLIQNAAKKEHSKDKRLLFMSRPHGTYCLRETELFKKGTAEYNVWQYYGEQTSDKILAYAVKITEIEGGRIKGNLYELDYQQHYKHVQETAVQSDMQTLHYKHGDVDISVDKHFSAEPHPEYGDFVYTEIKPNDLTELKCVLEGEHHSYERLQKGNIEKHIADLTDAAVRERLSTMSTEDKDELIGTVEICRDYSDMDGITQFDLALYNAVTAERAAQKPSIRRQLAESKSKSEHKKSITENKEDISL